MGLVIKTDGKPVTVVRQDKTSSQGNAYTQYSVMISSKNTDGTWVNDFIDCAFKKGTNIVNKTKIHINNAFFTISEYNGKKYKKLFITDFEIDGNAPQQPSGDGFMNIPDELDELPFMQEV